VEQNKLKLFCAGLSVGQRSPTGCETGLLPDVRPPQCQTRETGFKIRLHIRNAEDDFESVSPHQEHGGYE